MPSNNEPAVKGAGKALDNLKMEVAEELGLDDDIQQRGWENMTTREVGQIGGNVTKKLVEMAEENLAGQEGAGNMTSEADTADTVDVSITGPDGKLDGNELDSVMTNQEA